MRIGVFGLGYVGTVNAVCLAMRGHQVTGVEVDRNKMDQVNAGVSPVQEAGLDECLATAVREQRLCATDDAVGTVLHTRMSIVCVPTPSNANGSLRLDFAEHVTEQIAAGLRLSRNHHVVVFRSTMLPGSVEDRLVPILADVSRRTPGQDFSVVFHPEFLREGTALHDFEHPPKIVIGHDAGDSTGAAVLSSLYEGFAAPLIRTSIRVAEVVKYIDNIFHSLKVVFANEVGNVCKSLGVDSLEALRIFCEDTKLNLSPAYLRPGYAFGGSCLPKDLRAFVHEALSHDVRVPLLEAIAVSNEQQKARALQLVRRTGKRRIGILGLSFKAGTDDLRESPAVELVESLVGKGYQVAIYDPHICIDRLVGSNRRYIERELPHLAHLLRHDLPGVLEESEVIVATNRNPEFASVAASLRPDQILVDLASLPDRPDPALNYVGISW